MNNKPVHVFTRNGMDHAPEELQLKLAVKLLSLTNNDSSLSAMILFYTDGVKLACQGSPMIDV